MRLKRTTTTLGGVLLILAGYGCNDDAVGTGGDGGDTDGSTSAGSTGDIDPDGSGTSGAEGTGGGTGGDDEDPLVEYTQDQEPCDERHPHRKAYFGDLHLHTSYSFDAYAHETRNDPFTAYDFARGEKVCIGDLGDGVERGRVPVQLRAPLDFTAVTDHAELLGEVDLCTDPESGVYFSPPCVAMRTQGQAAVALFASSLIMQNPRRVLGACRGPGVEPDGENNVCVIAAEQPWARILEAADVANDSTSACEFVAFPAYEWTGSPLQLPEEIGATMHRNVIFRNDDVLARPISYFDETDPERLRTLLEESCNDADRRCQVLAIPHNSNASQGNAFETDYGDMTPGEMETSAKRRARMEPLMEIFQHKGASECSYKADDPDVQFSDDPSCEFELLGDFNFENPVISRPRPNDYLRGALAVGLAEAMEGRTNSLRLGVIASTDSHNGTPGATDERDFRGHLGATERDDVDLATTADGTNPGGLVGVWAVERSRDAIFEGMQRRETFGTSGTRILPRFFAGWDVPTDLCQSDTMLEQIYDDGLAVPMGSTIGSPPEGAALRFVVQAVQDEVPLAVTEIVKVWVDANGEPRETIITAAGDRDNGASVDPTSCERSDPQNAGMANTCAVVTDPEFDPGNPAVYYMRVLENPSCRYNRWICLAQEEARANPPGVDPLCGEPIPPPDYEELGQPDPCDTVGSAFRAAGAGMDLADLVRALARGRDARPCASV